jgi:hypothetical protein
MRIGGYSFTMTMNESLLLGSDVRRANDHRPSGSSHDCAGTQIPGPYGRQGMRLLFSVMYSANEDWLDNRCRQQIGFASKCSPPRKSSQAPAGAERDTDDLL